MKKWEQLERELSTLIDTQRKIVGVKVATDKAEYDAYAGRELIRPLSYCVAVKCATLNYDIKLTRETAGCNGGNRALGLSECPDSYLNGCNGCMMGLYADEKVASEVAQSEPICSSDTYGVIVKPLGQYEDAPDVIIIVCNTREAMRVMQGYTFTYGLAEGLNMSGNQAVCVEATVTPLKRGGINVSMFCSGTREKAKWRDDEVIIGISKDRVEGVIRGLKGTVNAIEYDCRKKEIEEGLKQINSLDFKINYGKTYFKTWKNNGGKG